MKQKLANEPVVVERKEIADFLTAMPGSKNNSILAKLSLYLELLLKWNKRFNLVGCKDPRSILYTLISDSFYLADFLQKFSIPLNAEILDLGSGAGLPGVPLRMIWQTGNYTMIECREKRALFIANALALLNLPRTEIFRGSIETFFTQAPQKADCIISRAFKPWRDILEICQPQIMSTGILIIMANQAAPDLLAKWRLIDQYCYKIQDKDRFFWALTPDSKQGFSNEY